MSAGRLRALSAMAVATNAGHRTDTPMSRPRSWASRASDSDSDTTPCLATA